jgi:hypothetical protein
MTTPAFAKFASPIGIDRLVRKEVSLGVIREKLPPQDHIGLQFAPFMDVATDDVIFDYIKGGLSDGLAPARAEDAEAELSQKDEGVYGQGRAAIVDWSIKDKYTASDVTRFREALFLQQQLAGTDNVNLPMNFVGNTVDDFNTRLARHDALRRRKLDNRIEWLIMTALDTGAISYNDGRIKFAVDYGRPTAQYNQAPASGTYASTTHDPIGDILAMQDYMYNLYGVRPGRAIASKRFMNSLWKSAKFTALTGLVVGGTPVSSPIDPNYLIPGWSPQAAIAAVEAATGVQFTVYDSVYRTRPVGSTTWTNNRFTTDTHVIFLPNEADMGEIDDTQIGFAKTLTSPHPEGDWQSGYYEWEDEKRDPWLHVRGSGIKAFPVFPYMEYTFTWNVTLP